MAFMWGCIAAGGAIGDNLLPDAYWNYSSQTPDVVVPSSYPVRICIMLGAVVGGFVLSDVVRWCMRPHLRVYAERFSQERSTTANTG